MDSGRFEEIREIMANVMMVDPEDIQLDSTPNTLSAWDSMRHLNLVLALEDTFGFALAPEEADKLIDVRTIVMTVDQKLQA